MHAQAADRLRAVGYTVVGAYLSPSHDAYVQPKAKGLGTFGFSSGFRLAIARKASDLRMQRACLVAVWVNYIDVASLTWNKMLVMLARPATHK